MPKKHPTLLTFLMVGISFIFTLACDYSYYNILIEADFITHGAKFEAKDLDHLWAGKQTSLDFMPSESPPIAPQKINVHGLFITSQIVFIGPLFSVLRC